MTSIQIPRHRVGAVPGPGGEVVVYETPDGEVRVEVRLERETVWLTQKQMAALFGTSNEKRRAAPQENPQRRRAG
jgi:hypothetical protein